MAGWIFYIYLKTGFSFSRKAKCEQQCENYYKLHNGDTRCYSSVIIMGSLYLEVTRQPKICLKLKINTLDYCAKYSSFLIFTSKT